MAKVINLSDDAGVTQYPLPGSEGSFSSEAEAIDDTVLGQTFQSSEIGLTGWSISGNGIFKGFAGYVADIMKFGTPTTFTNEAMSLVSGETKIYQIDDPTREVWNRDTATTFRDATVTIPEANIVNVDYLFGRVELTAPAGGAVDATGEYMVRESIGRANTFNLTMTAEAIDETDFATAQGNTGTRVFQPGLRTVALELGGIFSATENAKADLAARSELIVEIDPAGDGLAVARGFFKFATVAQAGAVGALEEETLNLALTVPVGSAVNAMAVDTPFNWAFDPTSTLSAAIQVAITSWIAEDNTVEVQYLPLGAVGQSPLDGVEGKVVFTDISLSGGLSNMNTFVMEMQGTDVFNVV
jgi:hypothetical protein